IATGNDCYQLTYALNYQNGTVWYANQIDLTQSFDITFEMNLGNNDGGADGICFVMHTQGTSAIGQSGGGLGYLNFGTSIAVEFDTWQNGEYGDPTFDHLAIVKNGDINHNGVNNLAGPVQMDPFAANTEDGQTRTVRITWNPSTQIFQVYYNCVFRAQSTVDIINSVFGGQNLVYWGFTAATGGAVNVQTVCLTPNILNVGNEVEICQGGSTTLSVGAALNNTYSWSPATYLSDSTSSSPVASPPTSTTYTVSYTDLCGTQVAQSINVIVEPLTVNLSTPTTLTCSNPITTISSTSNFTGINYNWLGPGITTASAASSIQLNAAGWYILQSNINNQCFDEDSVLIMSDQIAPELTLISTESELNCSVITSTLSAEPNLAGVNYTWSGFNIAQNNGSSIIINGPGSFNCIALDPNNGCTSSSNISINQNIQAPQLNGPITDTLTCQAPTAILNNWVDLNPMMTTNYTWQ
ncbi:MAG: L-type lectin-domain containing protein, partial [Bacteroidota bacterium]